ncbi:hypothetical protein AB0D29_32180 [Streptomyces sp. NPDC048424]|uniref:hypothetical protein n=1 Tax=Streptomyces sp. NPDC048424 TaxID=3155265 RepID=UPI003428D19E
MARAGGKPKRALRTPAAAFTVSAPHGARIRDRLRLSGRDAEVLRIVGEYLGGLARADLADRVRIGTVAATQNRRAARKRALTRVSSSRWAGAITRASEDQYQLSLRCLLDERTSLRRAVSKIRQRAGVPCGQRVAGVRGYSSQAERAQKQRRLRVLPGRMAEVEARIEAGHPAIVVGGRRLVKTRHNLTAAGLTSKQWREQGDARRMFLTADGESGAPYGNYTITVDPADGTLASWSCVKTALPTPSELAAAGARLLAVDLNAGHLAACVVDVHGNPVGEPVTLPTDLTGPASRRDGRLRAAITELVDLARANGCDGLAIENLGFGDARSTGRETMGRGKRGKAFRRTVAGLPTARFRERLRSMAHHRGLVVVAVDPAYTSRWGRRYWQAALQEQSKTTLVTGHHAAAVAIGRRALGHGTRRRPGVTAHDQRIVVRRATGQTAPRPTAHGTTSPPRTTGAPHEGRKTCWDRSERFARVPASQDRSGRQPASPGDGDSPNSGQYR